MPWTARVQPVPSAHAYSQGIRRQGADGPVTYADDPAVPGAPDGVWWPPPALDPAWVHDHAADVDLVHLHFGFDAETPEQLDRWCDALDDEGLPLVLTVHDLVNPHFTDQTAHRARLDALVPRAAKVLTLTHGAAREIREHWHRPVDVVPHPHVAPLDLVGTDPGRRADRFVVGLHLKSLRANVRATALVAALADVLEAHDEAELTVHLHREVLDPGHPRHDAELVGVLTALDRAGRATLVVHEPHSDDELWAYLRGLDLSVMPYAFGTHSGWLEACHDLGTAVLAPRTGYWVEQRPCLTYASPDPVRLDRDELARVVASAVANRPTWPADREERRLEQDRVARHHEGVYRSVLTAPGRAGAVSA